MSLCRFTLWEDDDDLFSLRRRTVVSVTVAAPDVAGDIRHLWVQPRPPIPRDLIQLVRNYLQSKAH